jgi:hypothetical protein
MESFGSFSLNLLNSGGDSPRKKEGKYSPDHLKNLKKDLNKLN